MALIVKCHKWLAMIISVVLLLWAATGLVFLVKPGYSEAYQQLSIKTYPLRENIIIRPQPEWLEYRVFRTILGLHVVALTESGWEQFDPVNRAVRHLPAADDLQSLMQDSVALYSERYGQVLKPLNIDGDMISAVTSTKIQLTLDWNRFSLKQVGNDTRLIKKLYKLHYLQWTGNKFADTILGVLGLLFLVTLVISGLCLLRPKN